MSICDILSPSSDSPTPLGWPAYFLLPGRLGEQGKKVHHIPNTYKTQKKLLHSVSDCLLFSVFSVRTLMGYPR